MKKLVLIDGNSILNRAFYGIMGSKMLMTEDGTYTNAVYGFLAILFKIMEDIKPEYMVVAFDLKAPTARHKLYEGYKATRKGMPEELASQMPIIKEVLQAMNVTIIEKEGYEADDVLGTMSRFGQDNGLDVTILSGDRDTFQLVTPKITVRIPRTKAGKTETEVFDVAKIKETYGLEPEDLIQVKGLMGDTSDNIPGVPGVGEKTALTLVKDYKTIDNLYQKLEEGSADISGKLKEKLTQNKELAYLSRELGTINLEVPITETLEEIKVDEWDKAKVLELFQMLRFNRYIDRFSLREAGGGTETKTEETDYQFEIKEAEKLDELMQAIKRAKKIVYSFGSKENVSCILKKEIKSISIYMENENTVYYIDFSKISILKYFKAIFEDKEIAKISNKQKEDYILLRQEEIQATGFSMDVEIAAYLLNSTNSKYSMELIASQYLNLDITEYLTKMGKGTSTSPQEQMNLFDAGIEEKEDEIEYLNAIYAFSIGKLEPILLTKLQETNQLELFKEIEMPLVEVLASMQYEGIYVDKQELMDTGKQLQEKITVLTQEIYILCGEQFNINSPKQLGEMLFEKLQLPTQKKNKSGYSTDVDTLEKLKGEHAVIEKLLEYRQLTKLNSTYVEGLIPYINEKTGRIHSYLHQTVTATGRISSTEPNLQNIPTRIDLGKQLRKVFKSKEKYVFIDADYSQIELRILAHISQDEHMVDAFNHGEDIHKQAASKVLNIPMEEVTKEQRSAAKAVNFGIVYGISDFGLSEQLGIGKKQAKEYIEQYLEQYSGIKQFMDTVIEETKEKGYAETLYHRRRYVPELSSKNYMIRQFGSRVAMNTPIQGTAADIMKIAMIHVYEAMKQKKLKSKLILQIHDELLIESPIEEAEEAKKILKDCMENVIKLSVPLQADLSEADNWYDVK